MAMFEVSLLIAALLCSLVAGFLFAYAVVIMPGFSQLDDRAFLLAFQVTDRIIQDNQPLFVLVWLGSIVAVIAAAILAIGRLAYFELALMELAALAWMFGVQAPTFAVNLPLNRRLKTLTVEGLSEPEAHAERKNFESSWIASNRFRTVMAFGVSLVLLVLLYRLP